MNSAHHFCRRNSHVRCCECYNFHFRTQWQRPLHVNRPTENVTETHELCAAIVQICVRSTGGSQSNLNGIDRNEADRVSLSNVLDCCLCGGWFACVIRVIWSYRVFILDAIPRLWNATVIRSVLFWRNKNNEFRKCACVCVWNRLCEVNYNTCCMHDAHSTLFSLLKPHSPPHAHSNRIGTCLLTITICARVVQCAKCVCACGLNRQSGRFRFAGIVNKEGKCVSIKNSAIVSAI